MTILISRVKIKTLKINLFILKEGTLYPILYRLEDENLVESHWSEPKGKEVSRKYYRITGKGKQELEELCRFWEDFQEHVTAILRD